MTTGRGLLVIERILRDREGVWRQIFAERDLGPFIRQMSLASAVGLACYGAVLGASNGWLQALSSAVKLPVLFFVTIAICLPTLYLFNLVFGARLSVRQALALVLVAVTVASMLAVAFASISLFFLISAWNYAFYKVLNVTILALVAIVGLRFLVNGMASLNAQQEAQALAVARAADEAAAKADAGSEPDGSNGSRTEGAGSEGGEARSDGEPARTPVGVGAAAVAGATPIAALPAAPPANWVAVTLPNGQPGMAPMPVRPGLGHAARPAAVREERPASMALLYIWILLFGFVGTQLGWTLRPFFGDPGMKFSLFRALEGNFYADVVRTLGHLFG